MSKSISNVKTKPVLKSDVAQLAGVSHMTVTRVLQNSPHVRPETRKKVLEALDQLNWRPNIFASGLRDGKSYAIGIVVPVLGAPIFGRLINGIEERATELGYNLVIMQEEATISEMDKRRKLEFLLQRRCDGLIVNAPLAKSLQQYLAEQEIPIVVCDVHSERFPYVTTDDVAGTRDAMNYLIDLGHHKIVHLAGTPGTGHADIRRATYISVLQEHGIEVNENLIVGAYYNQLIGYNATIGLIDRDCDFTAIFAAGDQLALGAMLALYERGIKVPDDVSVIGYSGDVQGEFSCPPLTSVYQPFEKIGRNAVDLLMRQLQGDPDVPMQTLHPTKLIKRHSCKCPRR